MRRVGRAVQGASVSAVSEGGRGAEGREETQAAVPRFAAECEPVRGVLE